MKIEEIFNELPLSKNAALSETSKSELQTEILNQCVPVENIADVGGVYFLIYKGEIVYIGQSNSVYNRINTHAREPFKTFDSFFILFIENYSERLLREKQLINSFKPYYNDLPIRDQGFDTVGNLEKELGISSSKLWRLISKYKVERYNLYYNVDSLKEAIQLENVQPEKAVQIIETPKLF